MNRNVNSRFAVNPVNLDRPRSTFNRPQSIKFTGNISRLIPFYVDEILPGDSMKVKTAKVVRMQPLVSPIMDNVYLDTYYFFVPMRLVWQHTKEFFGENTAGAWIPQSTYSIPQVTSPSSTGWTKDTIADYMGIPTGVTDLSVSALPFRAYALICNEWFRSEVLTDPLNIPTGDSTQTGSNGDSYINDIANGGMPFKVAKYFDYFSGALPSPQKGDDVTITLAGLSDTIPVYGNGYGFSLSDGTVSAALANNSSLGIVGTKSSTFGATVGTSSSGATGNDISASKVLGVPNKTQLGNNLEYSGLIGDLSSVGSESVISINQLRQAFQIQKYFERSARGGSRYVEYLKAAFGVTSPDSRLQRPEYLGGNRLPINVSQVVQTSETSNTSPMGDTAAYSLTTDDHNDFNRSFTEHGYVLGLCVARYEHSYQQGIERMWSRKNVFDFYDPIFANLGEQAILNKEIFAQGSSVVNSDTGKAYDEEVFGFQERWAEYRYKPNRISGEMRSTYTTPLDMWHLGDVYSQLPSLSDAWLREDQTNLDRCLAVTSVNSDQLLFDIYVQNISTRIMPIFSIPGLIDHH